MLRLTIRRSKKIFAAEIVSLVSSEERTACAACRRRRLRRAPCRHAKRQSERPGEPAAPEVRLEYLRQTPRRGPLTGLP